MITVVIPVGPEHHHCQYLDEALRSLSAQTVRPDEVLIVDDMHGLDTGSLAHFDELNIRIHYNPWRLGVAASFNVGVALTTTGYSLMMGADDRLHPDAIKFAEREIATARKPGKSYFYFGVRYFGDHAEVQEVPCGAAVVPRSLWEATGGFAPETGVGAPDASLISTLLSHPRIGNLVPIADAFPLYYARVHVNQDTAQRGDLSHIIVIVRQWVDENWKPPKWGRKQ